MGGDLSICILKQKISDSQRTAQIWQLVLSSVELIVQIVGYEAFYEAFEECINAC